MIKGINGTACVFSQEEIAYIVEKYTNNRKVSLSSLGREFGVHGSTIKKILIENGVEKIKNQRDLYRIPCDDNFFETIDTEEKAYVFGFFSADGNISKNQYFHFKISEKDDEILQKIKIAMNYEGDVLHFESKKQTSFMPLGYKMSSLTICSPKIVSDLKKMGITNDKTHDLVFPKAFLPNRLIHHYIRGYFDGDGSVFLTKNKNNYGKIYPSIGASIVGTKSFLDDMCYYIPIRTQDGKLPIYKHKGVFAFQINCFSRSISLYNYLYKDATIYLDRKKNKFEELLGDKITPL